MPDTATSQPATGPLLDADLIAKAKILKESPLFVNPSDGVALLEKQMIFLVLAGMKPVAEVASGHWEEIPGGRRTVADDPLDVERFLKSLGLASHIVNRDGHAIDAVVSLRSELVKEMVDTHDTETVGLLFGFPETAARAYTVGNQALLPLDEQDHVEQEANIHGAGAGFRLSRDHWQDELTVVKQWYAMLNAYGLSDV